MEAEGGDFFRELEFESRDLLKEIARELGFWAYFVSDDDTKTTFVVLVNREMLEPMGIDEDSDDPRIMEHVVNIGSGIDSSSAFNDAFQAALLEKEPELIVEFMKRMNAE